MKQLAPQVGLEKKLLDGHHKFSNLNAILLLRSLGSDLFRPPLRSQKFKSLFIYILVLKREAEINLFSNGAGNAYLSEDSSVTGK
jgi:hypothetical protein